MAARPLDQPREDRRRAGGAGRPRRRAGGLPRRARNSRIPGAPRPRNTEWQRDLSVSHNGIGDVLVAQGDRAGALAAYRAGLEIRETLARRDPGNTEWQRDLSVSQ